MALATQDPEKTSLIPQAFGAGLLVVALFVHNWPLAIGGTTAHFVGDAWFFFQLKARKAI
jgi:hypothetical protein